MAFRDKLMIDNLISSIDAKTSLINADLETLKRTVDEFYNRTDENYVKKPKLMDAQQAAPGAFSVENIFSDNVPVKVYVAGASENPGTKKVKAGLGIWFGPNDPKNRAEPTKARGNEIVGGVAEFEACVKAINVAREYGIKKLLIVTENDYAYNAGTRDLPKWKANNWCKLNSNQTLVNRNVLIELDRNIELMEKVEWNLGVDTDPGCKGASALAEEGRAKYITI